MPTTTRSARLDFLFDLPLVVIRTAIIGSLCLFAVVGLLVVHSVMVFYGLAVALLAGFIGLLIFMILALDRPFRGDLGLTPGPYRLVYDHLMKGDS